MRIFILCLLVSIVFPVFASQAERNNGRICAPFRGGIVDPAIVDSMLQAAQEGRLYRIREKSSTVGFCVDSVVGRIEARFKGVQGGLAMRWEVWGDASQMLVMIDANSLATKEDFIKDMLKSEHFFDTDTYSRILFVSTKLRWLDRERAVLDGMLTMRGKTRPVHFHVKMTVLPNENADNVADIVVIAKSFIDRADFDMDRLSFLVSNTVELCMRIEASLFKE